jgi:hypothetical protein
VGEGPSLRGDRRAAPVLDHRPRASLCGWATRGRMGPAGGKSRRARRERASAETGSRHWRHDRVGAAARGEGHLRPGRRHHDDGKYRHRHRGASRRLRAPPVRGSALGCRGIGSRGVARHGGRGRANNGQRDGATVRRPRRRSCRRHRPQHRALLLSRGRGAACGVWIKRPTVVFSNLGWMDAEPLDREQGPAR